jgi:hypothetical protein
VAATAISTVAYPTLYSEVRACTWTGCALMLARNGLLAAAAVLSLARLWRSTVTRPPAQARPRPASPGTREAAEAAPAVHA